MTRLLTTAGALALSAVMISGAALAEPVHLAQDQPFQAAPWHYEWQYHYGKWGQYVPGWVPVLNNIR